LDDDRSCFDDDNVVDDDADADADADGRSDYSCCGALDFVFYKLSDPLVCVVFPNLLN